MFKYLTMEFRAKKKFRQSRGVAVRVLDEFCIDVISAVLRATVLRFSANLRHLSRINAPHTQNFEISRANS
jgi:hypothetical protein